MSSMFRVCFDPKPVEEVMLLLTTEACLSPNTLKEEMFAMGATDTRTTAEQRGLDERIARLRTQLWTTPQGRKMLQELSPSGMINTDRQLADFSSRDVIDFTDWQQWSQWSQSS